MYKTVLLLVAAATCFASEPAVLVPQGPWPLCDVIHMPGCYPGMDKLFMFQVTPVAGAIGFDEWMVEGTLVGGAPFSFSGKRTTGNPWVVSGLDFGGIAATWTITVRLVYPGNVVVYQSVQ